MNLLTCLHITRNPHPHAQSPQLQHCHIPHKMYIYIYIHTLCQRCPTHSNIVPTGNICGVLASFTVFQAGVGCVVGNGAITKNSTIFRFIAFLQMYLTNFNSAITLNFEVRTQSTRHILHTYTPKASITQALAQTPKAHPHVHVHACRYYYTLLHKNAARHSRLMDQMFSRATEISSSTAQRN